MRQKFVGTQGQVAIFHRPLPLGEGWGEGLASTAKLPHSFFLFLYASRPHPGPLPEGEGNKKPVYRQFIKLTGPQNSSRLLGEGETDHALPFSFNASSTAARINWGVDNGLKP